ncbi:MAG TPA: GntG family PLP-dependent aldolase [Verrucomicrobiae bacterium]|nr:GntG family PLP-dependent aldolase [Verrucomicrobiae bacterium]
MGAIDLRSDTVTLPSAAMRAVMAAAAVGDDQFGEDPSVNRLQDRVAALLGKPAALWLPTGTMATQVALRLLTRPGDDVVVSRESHAVWYETGAAAANAGIQFTEVGSGGTFTAEEFCAAVWPRDHLLNPPTTCVVVENTHNRGGGVVFPPGELERICRASHERQISAYCDGARLWNAAAASGRAPAELAAPFDLVAVAFSKGLGAPGGSVLAGSVELIRRATRYRRMQGGAMRQVGFFAAAALHALDHNLERLPEDHANARQLAEALTASSRLRVDLDRVQTNIVMIHLLAGAPTAATLVARAAQQGVLLVPFGPRTVRAVTHLDVSTIDCRRAATVVASLADAE